MVYFFGKFSPIYWLNSGNFKNIYFLVCKDFRVAAFFSVASRCSAWENSFTTHFRVFSLPACVPGHLSLFICCWVYIGFAIAPGDFTWNTQSALFVPLFLPFNMQKWVNACIPPSSNLITMSCFSNNFMGIFCGIHRNRRWITRDFFRFWCPHT